MQYLRQSRAIEMSLFRVIEIRKFPVIEICTVHVIKNLYFREIEMSHICVIKS